MSDDRSSATRHPWSVQLLPLHVVKDHAGTSRRQNFLPHPILSHLSSALPRHAAPGATRVAPDAGARPRRFAPWRGGGGERNRTVDLLLAKQALSQLSYTPTALGIAQSPWRAPARTRSVRRESPHRADQPRAVNKAAVSRRPGLGWSLSGTRPLSAQQELRLTRRPRCAAGAKWWAREDLNLRPHAYQARALTN